mmetsp:Transcript_14753/g.20599  ORF Transcript_14753/g.20599 Transcript_14753/m.20599 type:complete len:133 (+) Transcript_14753:315-713(+)|eukprot:CAMPEP_0201489090 /NCGR_PEP_ID=MMETSP0151_2-20130828/21017_1 /ASSEMBLY_ACC=CAM_ASM_000257 /TAXON_ID=200890 /ORGANISM="Paramoeba atlantica, Strain 621/1 / CCAP 1560/9" /LENGTH=132 /DNA_ID=CAMNT_0047874567 /DNA_START=82 /DNA_END=480 /DNA_ORIENTATION=+
MDTGEDASKHLLGPDFQNAQCLLYAEVAILLEFKEKERHETEPSEVFRKTLKYTQQLSHFKTKQSANEVRALLTRKDLFPFEIASMANLVPGTADEARSLIPTLHDKLEDAEIEEILNDMKAYESKYVFETK